MSIIVRFHVRSYNGIELRVTIEFIVTKFVTEGYGGQVERIAFENSSVQIRRSLSWTGSIFKPSQVSDNRLPAHDETRKSMFNNYYGLTITRTRVITITALLIKLNICFPCSATFFFPIGPFLFITNE